jgi:hypothetical protein
MNSPQPPPTANWRETIVLASWLPAVAFVVFHVLSALPFRGSVRAELETYGLMGGFASVLTTPVAVILSLVFWSRLRRWVRVTLGLLGTAGLVATIVVVLAYANPFFRG